MSEGRECGSPHIITDNTMQKIKISIATIARRAVLCAVLLLCSCCLTSCSLIGSIIKLPFKLIDAILG